MRTKKCLGGYKEAPIFGKPHLEAEERELSSNRTSSLRFLTLHVSHGQLVRARQKEMDTRPY